MNIFKNYFKIVKVHKYSILLYSAIFIGIAFINSQATSSSSATFTAMKPTIAYFDESKNELSKGLESYLKTIADVVSISPQQAEDDLFFSYIQAIVTVESNFDLNDYVEYKSAPGATSDFLVQQKLNQYLRTVKVYHQSGFSTTESIAKAQATLVKEAEVNLFQSDTDVTQKQYAAFFFNGLNYVLMAQIIIVIGLVTRTFYEETLLKRNEVSSISKVRFNLELIAGHVTMSLLIWLSYMVLSWFFFRNTLTLDTWGLFVLNSSLFLLSIMALAFLMTRVFTTPEAASGGSNVISLGSSFFAGAFVPQSMLPPATLAIGRLLPSFYYIANNDQFVTNPNMNLVYQNWFILIGFTAVFLILAIFIKPKPIRKER